MKKIFSFFILIGGLGLVFSFFIANTFAAEELPPPGKISPSHYAKDVSTPVTFMWRSVSGADKYQIKVWLEGGQKEVAEKILTGTQRAFSLDEGVTYWWSVKACHKAGIGGWSNDCDEQRFGPSWIFTTKGATKELSPPLKISPAHYAKDVSSPVNFLWRTVSGADKYQIKVWLEGGTKEVAEKILSTNQRAFSLDEGVTYWWSVKACHKAGIGGWSNDCDEQRFGPSWIFTTKRTPASKLPPPQKKYPVQYQTGLPLEVKFDWEEVPEANTYKLQLWYTTTDGDRYYLKEDDWFGKLSPEVKLPHLDTEYYWNMKSCDGLGRCGDWGDTWTFNTVQEKTPTPAPTPSVCNPDGCNNNCPENCTINEDPDCGCKDNNGCCGIGCDYWLDNDCPSCVSDNKCNGICSSGCTVNEDPDCGCRDNNNCCGINCTYSNDNDCERPTPGTPDGPTTPGITAPVCYTCSPGEKGGLVPCGRSCDDPDTPRNECDPCQFCDFFVMINNIIKFVMFTLVPVVAVLMLIIGGVMFFFAGAKPAILIQAKGIITSVIIGLIIIFAAWVIVNTVLTNIGLVQSPALLQWYQIECQ